MANIKLTEAQRKRLEQEAKKRGYPPGQFLDLVAKGVRIVADPIPPIGWLFKKKKKK